MGDDPQTSEITIEALATSVANVEQSHQVSKKTERRRFVILVIVQIVVAVCTALSLYLHYHEMRQVDSDRQMRMLTELELQVLPYSVVKGHLNLSGDTFEWRGVIVDLHDRYDPSANEAVIVVVNPHDVSTGVGCLRGSLWAVNKSKLILGDIFDSEALFSPGRGVAHLPGYIYHDDIKYESLKFLDNCRKEHPLVKVKFIPFSLPTNPSKQ